MKKFEFNGKIMDFTAPRVMGILNVTPDSFYDGGRYYYGAIERLSDVAIERSGEEEKRRKGGLGYLARVEKMVEEGAYIVDIGAVSTRPGAVEVSVEEEKARLIPVLKEIRKKFPGLILSIDTYRSEVAEIAIKEGADMINDISAGNFDDRMLSLVAESAIPYIMMHIQGTPGTMQVDPHYEDVVEDIYAFLKAKVDILGALGHDRIIVDPGFGFGKSVEHNYELLGKLGRFSEMGLPVLCGLSRKSMINKVLKTKPENALNGTSILNTIALLNGADILRVHDVKEAAQAIMLVEKLKANS